MLVLTRRVGEEIVINGNIRVMVLAIHSGQVRLGFQAPASVPIYREECLARSGLPGPGAKLETVAQSAPAFYTDRDSRGS